MSRIIVKNVPSYITEQRLKTLFSEKGIVTDVKLMFTRAGVFRKFAFIGFSRNSEAETAAEYFNKTYIDTSMIQVEIAKPVGDMNLQRPWSIYSQGSSANEASNPCKDNPEESSKDPEQVLETLNESTQATDTLSSTDEKAKTKMLLAQLEKSDQDPKLKAFLHAMKPRTHKQIWSNEDDLLATADPVLSSSVPTPQQESEEVENPEQGEEENVNSREENQTCAEYEDIIETGRLFVRNLAYSTSEDDLREFFGKYGPLSEVHIPLDSDSKQPKGIAFISYLIPENAVKAFLELDGISFQGRLLHVIPSKAKHIVEIPESISFKQRKFLKTKADSQFDFNWNSMFLRSDTVASAISEKLKISKSELLSVDADSMAVRMALSETHIIADTKRYLEEQGLNFEGLKTNSRSEKLIIVKNIPFETTEELVKETFSPYGIIQRIILPPMKTIAFVEYLEPSEARKAFRKLAYSKFLHVPLYLEWAPKNMVPEMNSQVDKEEPKLNQTSEIQSADAVLGIHEDESTQDQIDSTFLFVKNLNFQTTEESLLNTFKKLGKVARVTVAKKKDRKDPSKLISMGFGFLEFKNYQDAMDLLKCAQNVVLDNHKLELKLSDKTSSTKHAFREETSSTKAKGSKLLIRNVPFEAN
eukprot:Sdes_comp15661_c0_seq1m4677